MNSNHLDTSPASGWRGLLPAVRRTALLLIMLAVLQQTGFAMAEEAARTVRYDWLTAGKVSGSLTLQVREDGSRVADFEFNDRGRGPKIHEVVLVGDDGAPVSVQISGHSYMGAPAEETFRVETGRARWESTLERGETAAGGFYSANDGSPEQLAVLARALLRNPGQPISLLPAGSATIHKVTERAVSHAEQTHTVSLFAISGLDLTPQYLWLDEDQELFALTLGWMGLAPQGWGESLQALQDSQDQAEADYHRQLAARLTNDLPANWILRNVALADVVSGTLQPNRLVVVSDGRIVRVAEDTGLDLPVSGDLQPRVIDGQGQVLTPGLWDMHTHLSLADGLLQIAAGVTTVRDLGNEPERLQEVRNAFDSGEVIGPRSFAAGFIDRKSPYSAPTGRLAENLEDALGMVREYAEAGYPQVKIYSSIDPEWVKPIAAAVHENGMRLSGHIPSYMTARQAVLDGFDEIQHINMLFLNFLAGPEDDTRTPLRFSLVAEQAGGMDLDAPAVTDFIALLKERGVVIDPTVTIFDSMFRHRSGELDPSYAMVADHMPPAVRRGMLGGEMNIDDSNAATYARSADALLKMIARLHAAGIPLVAGTDAMPGFALHRELELYQQAGISPGDVLRIATLDAARVAGAEQDSGSIAVGKRADFILLAGNPLEDISAVRRPVAVFKGDRWFDPALLYEAVGIQPFTR
jgi:imidazolonepropionase-like amidohydrolase